VKKDIAQRWFVASILGVGIALAGLHLGASVGDPVEPPGPVGGPGPGPGSGPGGGNKNIPPKKLQALYDRFEISLHATRRGKERFYSAYWDLNGDGVVDEIPGGPDDNGGFEHSVIEVYDPLTADYDSLACKSCHYPPAVASEDTFTDDTLSPGDCTDCHWNYNDDPEVQEKDFGVPAYDVAYCDDPETTAVDIVNCDVVDDSATRYSQDDVCLGCHGRQKAEHNLFTDVHRAIDAANPGEVPKFTCMGCHQETEMHGDGTEWDSHLDNPKTSCAQSGCHERELKIAGGKKATGGACRGDQGGGVNERCETFHLQHVADVDCTACHVRSNTTCNSCHFDSELDKRKRFYRQTPAKGFLFLMNYKDIQDPDVTKVRTATYQSLTIGADCVDGVCEFDPEDTSDVQTFAVFAPYAAHSVTRGEDLECLDCHVADDGNGGYEGNPAVAQYLTEGIVETTRWNAETNLLEGPTGIIPVPHDWTPDNGAALKMDFVYYLGNTTDPVSKNLEGDQWDFLKEGPDRGHMPYGTPLSEDQMEKLLLP
jgi:hypothetical protein